jgi:hypothetical protein
MRFRQCTGTGPNDVCDVHSFRSGQPFQRGKSTCPQVMGMLPKCHLQTPAEGQAANQNGPGGFKAGDTVRMLVDGWQDARIVQVHGRSYVVHLSNGACKSAGGETDGGGPCSRAIRSARPRAGAGEQPLDGGEVRGQNLNMYHIKVPGIDTGFGAEGGGTASEAGVRQLRRQIRRPVGARLGNGRDEGGIPVRQGHDYRRPGRRDAVRLLHGRRQSGVYKAGSFTPFSYDFDINNDGTLQTPLGAIKKMGN